MSNVFIVQRMDKFKFRSAQHNTTHQAMVRLNVTTNKHLGITLYYMLNVTGSLVFHQSLKNYN